MKICVELNEEMQDTFSRVKKYYMLIEPTMTDEEILIDTMHYFYDVHSHTLDSMVIDKILEDEKEE